MPQVRLEPVSLATWDRAAAMPADPAQDRFVPPVEESLLRWIGEGGEIVHEPLLVYETTGATEDDQPVGFVTLIYPANYHDRCLVAGLRIAKEQQGRGIGRATLEACVERIREGHPEVRSLYLTVHPENAMARALYERSGFTATNVRVGDQLTYSMHL